MDEAVLQGLVQALQPSSVLATTLGAFLGLVVGINSSDSFSEG